MLFTLEKVNKYMRHSYQTITYFTFVSKILSRTFCELKIKTELHVLDTVGESIEAEAQEQIKKEKQKTGVQVS